MNIIRIGIQNTRNKEIQRVTAKVIEAILTTLDKEVQNLQSDVPFVPDFSAIDEDEKAVIGTFINQFLEPYEAEVLAREVEEREKAEEYWQRTGKIYDENEEHRTWHRGAGGVL